MIRLGMKSSLIIVLTKYHRIKWHTWVLEYLAVKGASQSIESILVRRAFLVAVRTFSPKRLMITQFHFMPHVHTTSKVHPCSFVLDCDLLCWNPRAPNAAQTTAPFLIACDSCGSQRGHKAFTHSTILRGCCLARLWVFPLRLNTYRLNR